MLQSPSWEVNWFAVSQEIPRISRNPKVHYHTHKRPPPVSILGQPNPVHTPTSYLLEIHPNIIHTSTPRSPQWSHSLRFPHEDSTHTPSPHPYAPHAQPILNKIQYVKIFRNYNSRQVSTPSCFGAGMPSWRSLLKHRNIVEQCQNLANISIDLHFFIFWSE